MSIVIIVGDPGVGKTALLSLFQYNEMTHGMDAYFKAKKEILRLQQLGFPLVDLPPQKHLCFADYDFKISRRFSRYKVSGYEIGLPNPHFKTRLFPVGSIFFLDEAQKYFDSRISMYLREEVYRWFQLHRHNDYKFYMTAQRLANIDLNIRAIADKYIVIDKLEIKEDSFGRVSKLVWTTRQFTSCQTAEEYQLSKDKGEVSKCGEIVKISTDLNIFSYYDSCSNKPVFYSAAYSEKSTLEYDYFTETGYCFTMQGIAEFNNSNYFIAPKGYLKKSRNDVA